MSPGMSTRHDMRIWSQENTFTFVDMNMVALKFMHGLDQHMTE
jgi:hypothetical protein